MHARIAANGYCPPAVAETFACQSRVLMFFSTKRAFPFFSLSRAEAGVIAACDSFVWTAGAFVPLVGAGLCARADPDMARERNTSPIADVVRRMRPPRLFGFVPFITARDACSRRRIKTKPSTRDLRD